MTAEPAVTPLACEARAARALGFARGAMGVIFLARTTPMFFFLHAPFSGETFPLLGWPTREWSVAAGGLSLPSALLALLCVVRTTAGVFFACGVRARVAGLVASGAGYLVLSRDRFAFINSLHILFLGTSILALTAGTSAVALVPDERAPVASSVRLVTLFLASIYFWSGAAKLQSEWLSGQALEAHAHAGAFAGPLAGWLDRASLRAVAAWTIPTLELAIAALLATDRRRIAIGLALAFHVVVELTVNPDLLGWEMMILLLAVWPGFRLGGSGAEATCPVS